jgi:hypothetical protein
MLKPAPGNGAWRKRSQVEVEEVEMDKGRRISDDELADVAGGSDGNSDANLKFDHVDNPAGGQPPTRPPLGGGSGEKPSGQGGSGGGTSGVTI